MTSLFSWIRRLYSLDTLDTRFTVSASTPLKAASDARPASAKDARANAIAHGASPSKWNTPEFFGYYFVFITVVPMMFKTVVDVSKGRPVTNTTEIQSTQLTFGPESFPTYPTYSSLLSPGWIPGRKVVGCYPPETMAGY
jgi:hypothetical protein